MYFVVTKRAEENYGMHVNMASVVVYFRYYFILHVARQVLVHEVDEKQQAKDRERERQREETRMLDQLRHAESLDAVKRVQVKC